MTPQETRFLRACRRQPVDRTPVWIMRQAGRYLPEYRRFRERLSFLEMCRRPEVAAEVTLQPLRRFDLDAAIIFSDILLVLQAAGVGLAFTDADGPVIKTPVRSRAQARRIVTDHPEEDLGYVMDAIALVRRELAGRVPLIGFSGAPFTLASYLIEGGHSKNFERTKGMMYEDPRLWHDLLGRITDLVGAYLRAQVGAGAQALQVFDSWVGCLSPGDYREYVYPHSRTLLTGLRGTGVPVIHFGTGTATFLPLMSKAGGDVIGVDWRVPLRTAWTAVGAGKGVQGNLDPVVLLGSRRLIRRRVGEVLAEAGGRAGHVFNLGHGVLPGTPVGNVACLVDAVHELGARSGRT